MSIGAPRGAKAPSRSCRAVPAAEFPVLCDEIHHCRVLVVLPVIGPELPQIIGRVGLAEHQILIPLRHREHEGRREGDPQTGIGQDQLGVEGVGADWRRNGKKY